MFQKVVFSIIIFCLSYQFSITQSNQLSESEITEDIEVFCTSLLEAHPGIDIYSSDNELKEHCDKLKLKAASGLTIQDFYKELLLIVTTLQDGHTDLSIGKRFKENYPIYESILPFKYKIIDKQVYIVEDFSEEKNTELFSKIISINGIAIEEILTSLFAHTPADGNNLNFKRAYNEAIFGRQFAQFFGGSKIYNLELKQPDNQLIKAQIKGIKDSILHPNKYDKTPLIFSINKTENYAILTINTFQYRLITESGQDFHEFLKDSFKQLRKESIENLIIDLRKNYGGESIFALTLYSYLTTGNFQWIKSSFTKLKGAITYAEHSNYPEGNYRFMKTHDAKPIKNSGYILTNGIDSKSNFDSDFIYKGPNAKPENISKNKFDGKVYFLTSGLTFSAAAAISAIAYSNEEAIIIGEETGGSFSDFCGGGFLNIMLPNSKFGLSIPFMKRQKAVNDSIKKGSGTIPHYPIEETIESISKNEDLVLKKTIQLIQNQ